MRTMKRPKCAKGISQTSTSSAAPLPFEHRVSWRILPMPPASAVFDQLVIDGRAIRQEHIGHGAPVLVLAERLECDTTVTEK